MNNQGKPNRDINERTRQIPAQKSADAPTRQIPVQKSADAPTRQIPAQKSGDAPTRQIPAQKSADAPTRQIPAQKSADAPTRQVPVQKSADAPTRQIPAQKSADAPTRQIPAQKSADAPTRQVPIPGKASESPEASNMDTRRIPVSGNAKPAGNDNNSGTKVMNTAQADVKDAKKKKSRSLFEEKNDGGDSTALISIIKAVIYIVAVLVVSISVSIFIILVGNDVFAFVKSDDIVEITIPEGADLDDVASVLADNNVIKYPNIFKWYVDDDGEGFIPGQYSIPSNLDYDDLLAAFKEQVDEGTTWITIPEGYTTDEIIDLLVETGIGTKEGYVDVINNYAFDYWFVQELDATDWKASGRIYRLDGYLFPDTYEFYNESSERAVVEKLLARFNTIFGKKYREAAETMEMSVDEIIIIASMIEKEAGKAADYHLVSSVFHNRLASQYFPKMESDATALYAIHHDTGERPTDVTGEHMQYETPYNTYLHEGLPPGPIANPSASSINAALTPENTSYYYFVSDGYNTYFGRNNDEHEQNKAMVVALKNQ